MRSVIFLLGALLFGLAAVFPRETGLVNPGKFVARATVVSVQPEKNRLCAETVEIPTLKEKNEEQTRAFFFERENSMILMTGENKQAGRFQIDRVDLSERIRICGAFETTDEYVPGPGDMVGVELAMPAYKPQTLRGPEPIPSPRRIRHEVDKKIMLRVDWDYLVFGQGEEQSADNYNPHFFDRDPTVTPRIEAFYMDQYEVTNREYLFFCRKAGRPLPVEWRLTGSYPYGTDDHPLVVASYDDAEGYARWSGKRIPSELEWELAARGGLKLLRDGSGVAGILRSPRIYPMGSWSSGVCNTREMWNNAEPRTISVYELKDKSPYGIVGLCGSAREWTSNWYVPYPGQSVFSERLSGKQFRVLRGGSYNQNREFARVDTRDYGGFESLAEDHSGGIRLVISAR